MSQNTAQTLTVKQAKSCVHENIPAHWVQDWLLHVLNKPRNFLITDGDYVLTPNEQTQFDSGIAKMQAGTPLAYLTGKQAFWSLDFLVNEHTLIPRPDTEVLVEQVLAWIETNKRQKNSLSKNNAINKQSSNTNPAASEPKRLLDLGTGSGAIAISLAHELASPSHTPNTDNTDDTDDTDTAPWQVTALDYSTEALKVAKRNAQCNQVDNVEFIESDWFSALADDKLPKKFDVIVSNPPYIVEDDRHLDKLMAEPLTALVAKDNGLSDIKIIVEHTPQYLIKGGLLAIEHGYDQRDAVQAIFKDNGFHDVKTVQDYGGNDRVTMGTL